MNNKVRQTPDPDQGNPPRAELDPSLPTATAPESVEHAVYDEAEYAGRSGPDAADPPVAAHKSDGNTDHRAVDENSDPAHYANTETVDASAKSAAAHASREVPGTDLEHDEAADVMETRKKARKIKDAREDQQDENLLSLDPSD